MTAESDLTVAVTGPTGTSLPALPFAPPVRDWVEAATHPAIMNADKARAQLGWKPRYTSLSALQATIRGARNHGDSA